MLHISGYDPPSSGLFLSSQAVKPLLAIFNQFVNGNKGCITLSLLQFLLRVSKAERIVQVALKVRVRKERAFSRGDV